MPAEMDKFYKKNCVYFRKQDRNYMTDSDFENTIP